MLNRKKARQGIVAGTGAALGLFLIPQRLLACIPDGRTRSGSVAKARLPEPIEALEPYKERLHIINGLHGLHTSPSHSAFFGALGGYRGSNGFQTPASGNQMSPLQ